MILVGLRLSLRASRNTRPAACTLHGSTPQTQPSDADLVQTMARRARCSRVLLRCQGTRHLPPLSACPCVCVSCILHLASSPFLRSRIPTTLPTFMLSPSRGHAHANDSSAASPLTFWHCTTSFPPTSGDAPNPKRRHRHPV